MILDTEKHLILIKGAGDLASGVAMRLHCCGFPVVMTELPNPLMVRRSLAFGEAVYDGRVRVEGIWARRVEDLAGARQALQAGEIPVWVDPQAGCREQLGPRVVVDAIMAKRNTGTQIDDAPVVIALGPGFSAREDCHAVIETNRGHHLGRVIYQGSAEPDTGEPGSIGGKTGERILRAPTGGILEARAEIGEWVAEGQSVAVIEGQMVVSGTAGVLRGLVRSGIQVESGVKIGDVDPRAETSHCFTVSDKGLAIAGGVLEAILHLETALQRAGHENGSAARDRSPAGTGDTAHG
jgi:xanthine dehydrogenase accessory factor